MRVEVLFRGRLIQVRAIPASECVRVWDLVFPGGSFPAAKMEYRELRKLGEGKHHIATR